MNPATFGEYIDQLPADSAIRASHARHNAALEQAERHDKHLPHMLSTATELRALLEDSPDAYLKIVQTYCRLLSADARLAKAIIATTSGKDAA